MPPDLWTAYAPDPKTPWDLRRVVHLHRRAAFAGTWDELQRDLKDGPARAIDRLLGGTAAASTPRNFAATADLLAVSAVAATEITRLKAWWFYRMLFGPDPLREKLALLWHDHFATGFAKVRAVDLMWRQNEAFRKHGLDKFAKLLGTSVREPALLLYLDAHTNRRGHANENLARELMELFTLGVGHYTESDVKEAARCLTGWTVEDDRFAEVPRHHDDGEKTVLGKPGKWAGADLVRVLLEHPATSGRIAAKLCRQFFGERAPAPEAVKELASGLRERDLDLAWAVGTILRSRLFFADANLGTRVLSPVEFAIGAVRALGMLDPAPSTLALADWSARMGQDLFDPPNVGGWPGGRAWVHSRSLVARWNYAGALCQGPNVGRSTGYDPTALPKRHGLSGDADAVLTFHHRLLFGTDPSAATRRRMDGVRPTGVVPALLASPESQLG